MTITKAARKRIEEARKYPYDGIMYEGRSKPIKGEWVTLRVADFDALLAALDMTL
jgi:hypothetical protein